MDNKEAIAVIRSNWPDLKYSMLIEALEMSIKSLEAVELAATDNQQLNYAIAQASEFAKLCSDSKANGTMHSFIEWLEQHHN